MNQLTNIGKFLTEKKYREILIDLPVIFFPVFGWCHMHPFPEHSSEITLCLESHIRRNIRDRALCMGKKITGYSDFLPLDVIVDGNVLLF